MKTKKSYQEEADKLLKAIDISIDAYRIHQPKDWTPDIVNMVTNSLEQNKKMILEAEPKFRNLASLKYDIETVFIYFQEGAGETVEYFWKNIKTSGLEYKRENKLEKILIRGNKDRVEYEYVTDMILVAQQVGLTNKTETTKLNEMLGEFESKKKKKLRKKCIKI